MAGHIANVGLVWSCLKVRSTLCKVILDNTMIEFVCYATGTARSYEGTLDAGTL
jgi:hypothetical protein